MVKFRLVFVVTFVLLCVSVVPVVAQDGGHEEKPHWGYEGEEGPAHWGDLSEEYAACKDGHSQSPIDITGALPVDLNALRFDYQDSPLLIFNNGHTIQVNYAPGSTLIYNEITYTLLQFHFHQPSEHTINGEYADMEIHLVHQSADGRLAVVGVMMNVGDNVDSDYEVVFSNLPAEPVEPPEEAELMVNAFDLLPEMQTFYTYEGSLTTPPCTEIVRWLVMTEPVELSADEIMAFGEIYDANNRPVQPLNTRDLLINSE